VPVWAACHRADLSFKAGLKEDVYNFVDILANSLQEAALFWNNAPARLKVLRAIAEDLDTSVLKLGVLQDKRWSAFAANALRRFIQGYAAIVCGLREVPLAKELQRWRRDSLLWKVTNYTFVAGLHFLYDVVLAFAHMSKDFQYTERCAGLQDFSTTRCITALESTARWEGSHWKSFQTNVTSTDDTGHFLGVPLHNCAAAPHFEDEATRFLAGTMADVKTRFSGEHRVAKATAFLNIFLWPWNDPHALAIHGNDSVILIAKHFEPLLGRLPTLVKQFVCLKTRMVYEVTEGIFKAHKLFSDEAEFTSGEVLELFEHIWETISGWGQRDFGEIIEVANLSRAGVDATAVVERGWAYVNWRKSLHRLSCSASLMNNSVMIALNGPDQCKWCPEESAEAWYVSGKKRRRNLTAREPRNDRGKKRI
jgi:hypothetical protein